MPRNRSERSVSGDLVLDAYLRAFLRHHAIPWHERETQEGRELRRRHNVLCEALTDKQRAAIRVLGSDGALTLTQCRELFRHEPEFQHAP